LICALAVDGRRPGEEALLADALQKESRPDAAWCLKSELEFPYGARIGAPPFFGALSKTKALLDGFDVAIAEALAAAPPRPATAGAVTPSATARRVARSRGAAPRRPRSTSRSCSARRAGTRRSIRSRGRRAPAGWGESGLTDYEERRVKGLFCVDDDAVLHVGGRSRARGPARSTAAPRRCTPSRSPPNGSCPARGGSTRPSASRRRSSRAR
jgi:hypothetical protein